MQRIMQRFYTKPVERALEIGCGGGCNLSTLALSAKQVSAIEMDASAVEVATSRHIGEVSQGILGDDLPALQQRYELVGMFDVLEHIPDDAEALNQVRALLAADGRLFITVPAYMFLWTSHDEIAHHFRRYRKSGLCELLQKSGFKVVHASYFNTLLFPLAILERMLTRYLKLDPARTVAHPPRPINRLLAWIFSIEADWVPKFSLPFGLSILVVAEAE